MKLCSLFILFLILNTDSILGQCKLDSFELFDVDKSGKVLSFGRVIVKFDTKANLRIKDHFIRDTITQKLTPSARTTETLDANGRVISKVNQHYYNGIYNNNYRIDYTYYKNGNLESEIQYELDISKQFIIDKKSTYQYDSLNQYKYIQHFFFNKSSGTYKTYYDQEFKYFYSVNGQVIKKLDINIWPTYFTNKRSLYTYYPNGKIQTEINQFNDSYTKYDESSFRNRQRNEYVYNLKNNIISFRQYDIPSNDTTEKLISQIDYSYDAEDRIIKIGGDMCPILYHYANSGYTESSICGEVSYINYYSCIISTSQDQTRADWSVYPNPASDLINIHMATDMNSMIEYEIIDLTGTSKLNSILNTSQSIDISKLISGYYIIKLKQKNQIKILDFYKLK